MKVLGFVEAFEGKAFGAKAADGNEPDATANRAVEADPPALVKLGGDAESRFGTFLYAGLQDGEQLRAEGIVFRRELFYPLFHDLRIANGAEGSEDFAGNFADLRPGGIGIDLLHDRSEGATAANGDAQIVDRIGFGSRAESMELDDDPTRPVREGAVFSTRAWKMRDSKR